ncbi:hypothetical protein ACH4F6_32680 [Streptomyces sp. NPDC017936]|uniref:hypothetical protein n=1 Tax=Streptomyces sp. NPDC017936 TaxID=3365016 RepID=UPI0037B47F4A
MTAFRDAVEEAVLAEGLGIMRWQPQPVPAQTLFQDLRGYGRGCPWSYDQAAPGRRYGPDDHPVARDVCERRLVLGQTFSSLGTPNDTATLARYAEALHKVLVDERDALTELAWQEAGKASGSSCTSHS